jgi:hypothetical protein
LRIGAGPPSPFDGFIRRWVILIRPAGRFRPPWIAPTRIRPPHRIAIGVLVRMLAVRLRRKPRERIDGGEDTAGKLSTVEGCATTVEWLKPLLPRCTSLPPHVVQVHQLPTPSLNHDRHPSIPHEAPSTPFGGISGNPQPPATAASAKPGRLGRCRLPASQAAARARFTATAVNNART